MNRFLSRKRNIGFLLLTVVLITLFSWFVISVPPDTLLRHLLFYLILLSMIFSLCMFVFARTKTALVVGTGTVIYFLLRFLHLRHPIYGILLFICCMFILRLLSQKETVKKPE